MDGKSALPLVRGERATNYSELYLTECTWMRKRGWRTDEWKLIEAMEPDFHGKPTLELYNLLDDPGETRNLAAKERALVEVLRERMQAWVDKRVKETGGPDPILQYHLGTEKKIGSVRQARDLQARTEAKSDQKPDAKVGTKARARTAR
jgi:arylsulfatase A-like enzyme